MSEATVSNQACFGAGCYWGTEKFFASNFAKKYQSIGTIVQGKVGFMGPESAPKNPTYKQVCSGATGHVEVYQFEFKGGAKYYEEAVKFFFQFHDPTTLNRQGNDTGTQYASVIFCYDDEQFKIASQVKDKLQSLIDNGLLKCYSGTKVMTDIRKSNEFFAAHDEHQEYLSKNPDGYCNHGMRFNEWP